MTSQPTKPNSSSSNSRRTFLKTGALASSAVATSLTTLVQPVHAQGSASLKIGIVGIGGRGSGAATQAIKADPNVELVAAADVIQKKAEKRLQAIKDQLITDGEEKAAERVNVSEDNIFVGLDGYKQVIDRSDVVLLCTPPGFRPIHLARAVEAGKHIFTEKPMATDFPGLRSVVESVAKAKEKNLAVLAGFCWRYHQEKREFFEKIHEGAIGDVRAVYGTYIVGPVKPMPAADSRPEGMTDLEWQVRNWYNFAWLSGDGIAEQACHTADWIGWAFNDVPPESCTAVGGRQIPQEGGDIFDHVEINYVYGNGARAFLAQRQIRNCHNENSLYVIGTKGNASLSGGAHLTDLDNNEIWRFEGKARNMYQQEHDEFFASIRDGKYINDGDRMITSTAMALMGRNAGYTGKKLTWEEAMQDEDQLVPDFSEGWDSPVKFRRVPRPGQNING